MEDFNNFEEALEKSIKIMGRRRPLYYVMAKKGDITKFESTYDFKWDPKLGKIIKTKFESLSDRKLESDRHAEGDILIYDPSSQNLSWKTVYINSKGSYFKKHGKILLFVKCSTEL